MRGRTLPPWSKLDAGRSHSMKALLALFSALIVACVCVWACIAPVGALIRAHKPSVSSLEETGAKQGGEHAAKGVMSPSPSPTPTPGQ